jgi:hypothetical protein
MNNDDKNDVSSFNLADIPSMSSKELLLAHKEIKELSRILWWAGLLATTSAVFGFMLELWASMFLTVPIALFILFLSYSSDYYLELISAQLNKK